MTQILIIKTDHFQAFVQIQAREGFKLFFFFFVLNRKNEWHFNFQNISSHFATLFPMLCFFRLKFS